MCCSQKNSKILEWEVLYLHYIIQKVNKYIILSSYLLLQSVQMSHISVEAAPLTVSLLSHVFINT